MSSGSAQVAKRTDADGPSKLALLVTPDITGPRIRLGVLWFLLALAAITSGRLWTSVLCAVVAALSASQMVRVWGRPRRKGQRRRRAPGDRRDPGEARVSDRLIAVVGAGLLPLLAGYGTGALGAALIVVPIVVIVLYGFRGGTFVTALPGLMAVLAPGIAAAFIVMVVRVDLWAGLFLVMTVSMYDAGSFLHGAESPSRWEGPVAGVIGVFAVTFTMAVFHPTPFTPFSVAASGVVIAVACPAGQVLASKMLPTPDAHARGLRRLDAYLLAAPLFYVCSLLIVG